MNQAERRIRLIKYLLNENPRYKNVEIPSDKTEQFNLYRSLVNVRMPAPVSEEFLEIEDAFLKEETKRKGVTHFADLTPVEKDIYLWQGDITTIDTQAIVNAANSQLLGCFAPCHACIDNCIHTFAGVRLRSKCGEIMRAQGHEEPTGKAKITPAYNLPCKYVIHTVGPIVQGSLTKRHEDLLASCYRSCLDIAEENNVESIALCCISTGVFMFPNQRAAEIAVDTVKAWLAETGSQMKVVFNVYKDLDLKIYSELLQ